jgi:hypothetical protein
LSEHMPKSHREHAEWTPSRVIGGAKTLGESTGVLVEKSARSWSALVSICLGNAQE